MTQEGAELAPVSPPESRARLSKRSFTFDSLMTAGAGVFAYSLALITGPLLARNLGTFGRGELAAVSVPADLFSWLLCFGLPVAAVYYSRGNTRRSLVMSAWVFSLLGGGLFVAAVWFLIPSYLSGHLPLTIGWLRAFLIVDLGFAPVVTAIELLTAEGQMVAFNLWLRLPLVLNTVAVVGLAIIGRLTLTNALAASLGSNVVWFVAVMIALHAWPGRGFRLTVMRRQLSYGARQVPGLLSNLIVQRLDQFLLVGLVTPSELGVYAVAATASSVTGPLAEGISTVLLPRLLHVNTQHRTMVWRAVLLGAASSVLASLAVAVAVPWVIPFLFGPGFRASVVPVWIMLGGQVAANVGTIAAAKLLADGRPGANSIALMWAAAATVVGLFLFVGTYGIIAAAAVTTASQVVYLAYVVFALCRKPPPRPIRWVADADSLPGFYALGPTLEGGPPSLPPIGWYAPPRQE